MAIDARSLILILISVLLLALGQMLWKVGTNQAGAIDFMGGNLIPTTLKTITNLWFIFGCVCLLTSSVVWAVALNSVDLSLAFPFQSLAFVLIFILSAIFFKEPMTTLKIIGTILICAGVVVVAKG